MEFSIISLILSIIAFLVAITIHEFAHAWTANYLGDNTAKHEGRITLNPITHFDPIGSSMILIGLVLQAFGISATLFGWGKPVPVNPGRFKNPRMGWALVSFAGPLSNLALALVFSLVVKMTGNLTFANILEPFIILNVVLAVFNLIPIPPLDGSKILYAFLPESIDIHQLETAGPFILLFLIFTGTLHTIIWPVISVTMGLFGIGTI
ncbi:site-2 protease family protein [bacterium (Candidatus Howlettbacteria) CG_4_9_14_3_um_filter_37_10]|nr:MAG: site-2 protease family protein [bacterium (Candidatus Howlettbacteria) CG23_combo_of_CG06-09_8_20_14_all_37_9]PJB07356.1 MAG: site-2 protease family protein [bacterium (Candidatus Howlettbacteria) CG_4_9_14_3_um_filter_37_10]